MRVLLLNNVPAPYFIPLFRRLAESSGWQLTICFATEWRPDLGWPDPGRTERPISTEIPARTIYLNRSADRQTRDEAWLGSYRRGLASGWALLALLRREPPDYLICYGYTLLPQLTLLLWALFTGTPFALIGDANIYCDRIHRRGSLWKRIVKTLWLRLLTWRAAAILTIGTASQLFWESYGAGAKKLFRVPFAVDNDYFMAVAAARREEAREMRAALGLAEKTVFISIGRLVERKNVDLLIRAIRDFGAAEPVALLIVGTGEEQLRLVDLAAGDPRIIFLGGIAPGELPLYYGLADVMILAARDEPWGLVTNEAMACGLAVIAHGECGAAVDLVSEENGVILESFEIDELAAAMRRLAGDEEGRRMRQQASRKKIMDWNIEAAARGVLAAVEATCQPRGSGQHS